VRLRSLLFVPGDRRDRMDKALAGAADALILDLEDSVAEAGKAAARAAVADFITVARGHKPLLVRINPIGSPQWREDLSMAAAAGAAGVVLPKSEGAASVATVVAAWTGTAPACVLPIATETPRAIFALGSYVDVAASLLGLTWGAEDLSAAVGSLAAREDDGRYTPPYEHARTDRKSVV
jgi:citrate lyase subunit beta/citryl-CoA lyase